MLRSPRYRRPAAIVLGTLLLVSLVGCKGAESFLGGSSTPTAKLAGAKLRNVTLDAANLVFDVDVSNPYAVPLPLTNLDYALSTGSGGGGGNPFASGSSASQGEVPARGTKRISLPMTARFADLLRVAEGVKPGQVVPYTASFTFSAEAPAVAGGGKISLPVSYQGQLPIPTTPDVSLESIAWQALTISDARATMALRVVNRNAFAVDLTKLSYALSLGGNEVAQGGLGKGAKFAPGGEQTLEIPLSFSPKRLGLAGLQMLGGSGADYGVSGMMSFDTPFGPLDLPYQKRGATAFRR
jgi:LEA14-like dessication related protein